MTDALNKLIEAVEASAHSSSELLAMFSEAMPQDVRGCMALAWQAYNHGSLNTAKALHEALLGDGYIGDGWNYCVWGSGKASVWHIVSNQSFSADVPEREYHAQSPARAWLLAIIRAYAAQQEATP